MKPEYLNGESTPAMNPYILVCTGFANPASARPGAQSPAGFYLGTADVDANKGVGRVDFVDSRDAAMHFETIDAAKKFTMTRSKAKKYNAAGHPNQPIRSFNWVVKRYDTLVK